MIPRGKIDIGWLDLMSAACSWRIRDRNALQQRIEAVWSKDTECLVCLSVRSGLDLLLQALNLPQDSEILVSAITIRDMTDIIKHHGLIPIPVDLDMSTLTVKPESLANALTARSRAILVAHLFGSRMPLNEVIAFAQDHGLLVIEDCAQAFDGVYRGHPESDVCMFSFGPIKTNTALAGAIVSARDTTTLRTMRAIQSRYPTQSRAMFQRRVIKYTLLKALTTSVGFNTFVTACRIMGKNHDAFISGAVRGFPGPGLLEKIRCQPSDPLLALLERRLSSFDADRIARRQAHGRGVSLLLDGVRRPGTGASIHTHWVYPIQTQQPDMLMHALWSLGFDATRGASSLSVVDPPSGRPDLEPVEARRAMRELLYLPVYPGITPRALDRLAHAVAYHYSDHAVPPLHEPQMRPAAPIHPQP